MPLSTIFQLYHGGKQQQRIPGKRKFYFFIMAAILNGGRIAGHNFERGQTKDYVSYVCFNLVQRFQRRRFKCDI
jgi:hypothetical protein